VRTITEIAARAMQLDPDNRRWKVQIVCSMQRGDAKVKPFFRTISMAPEYLCDCIASQKALDAAILHEMGHYHDWLFTAMVVAPILLLFAFAFSLLSPLPMIIRLLPGALLLLSIPLRLLLSKHIEDRADRWAAARMPDYYQHKDAV